MILHMLIGMYIKHRQDFGSWIGYDIKVHDGRRRSSLFHPLYSSHNPMNCPQEPTELNCGSGAGIKEEPDVSVDAREVALALLLACIMMRASRGSLGKLRLTFLATDDWLSRFLEIEFIMIPGMVAIYCGYCSWIFLSCLMAKYDVDGMVLIASVARCWSSKKFFERKK